MAGGLTDEEKARVLSRLNRRRSEAASGALRHLPTAGNMLKLVGLLLGHSSSFYPYPTKWGWYNMFYIML
jgi:hypothetical protein